MVILWTSIMGLLKWKQKERHIKIGANWFWAWGVCSSIGDFDLYLLLRLTDNLFQAQVHLTTSCWCYRRSRGRCYCGYIRFIDYLKHGRSYNNYSMLLAIHFSKMKHINAQLMIKIEKKVSNKPVQRLIKRAKWLEFGMFTLSNMKYVIMCVCVCVCVCE